MFGAKLGQNTRMRTTRSSPIKMCVAGQLQNPTGVELDSEDIADYGTKGFINGTAEDNRPIFLPLSFHVSEACRQKLIQEVPQLLTSANFGIGFFLKAVDIIQYSNR